MGEPLAMSKNKQELFDILKESLTIPSKNLAFTILAALTSLPFLCFFVFFEEILQKTFLETSEIFRRPSDSYYYSYWVDEWPVVPFHLSTEITKILSPKLFQLFLLYLIPYHLLELFTVISVVGMASKLYKEEKPIGLKAMIKQPIKFKGPFITFVFVALLSMSALLGLIWVVTDCFIFSTIFGRRGFGSYSYMYSIDFYDRLVDFFIYALILVVHGAGFTLLLMKYLEWSAGWNMSVVISVLEEAYGTEAFEISGYFSRGGKQRGTFLMLIFFVWGLVLRLPCVFCGCYRRRGGMVFTFLYASLICAGNVVKWVVCMVYFFDCKKRVLEKKIDEEIGREVKESMDA